MQHEPNQWVMLAALAGVMGFALLVWFLRRKTLDPRDVMPTLDEIETDSGPRAGGRLENTPITEPPPAPPTKKNVCISCEEEFQRSDWPLAWHTPDFCPLCEPIERSVEQEFRQRQETERIAFGASQNAQRQNWYKVGKLVKIRQVREAERDRYREEQKRIEAELTKLRAFRGEK